MEREAAGEARVIPIILRPCDWHSAVFGRLLALPTDGKPVTKWPDRDDAFLDITKAIRAIVSQKPASPAVAASGARSPTPAQAGQRSSNLRMRQAFTERDRDAFLDDSFEFIARFFENSLAELARRNPGIECSYKRLDATRFTASVYRGGAALARCTIRYNGTGRGAFGGITLSYGIQHGDGINESLSVEVGEQSLFLKPMGMAMIRAQGGRSALTQEGAAEYYWSIFIEPLQR